MSKRSDILTAAQELAPNGRVEGHEYVAINPTRPDSTIGSFKINTSTGVWSDFADSVNASGKGIVSYAAYVKGIPYAEAKALYGHVAVTVTHAAAEIIPSEYAPAALIAGQKFDVYSVKNSKWQTLTAHTIHAYIHEGKCWSCVERVEATGDKKKRFRPMLWGNVAGRDGWYDGVREVRHFYNVDAVKNKRAVMIVSGEKCVDALQPLYEKHMAVITWMGGDNAADRSMIPDLLGKKIILWPDADESSNKSMLKLAADIAKKWESANIHIVNTEGFPEKYDAADAVADGLDSKEIEDMLKPRMSQYRPDSTGVAVAVKNYRDGEDWSVIQKMEDYEWISGSDTVLVGGGKTKKLKATSIKNAANFINEIIYNGKRIGDSIVYNVFEDKIFFINQPPWWSAGDFEPCQFQESDVMDIRIWLEGKGFTLRKTDIWDLIVNIARRKTINPAKEYFDRLVWDGKPRLATWLKTYLGCNKEPDKYLSAVGTKWLLGAVNRIYEPGCTMQYCLILEGAQGVGKSSLFRELGKFNDKDYFSDMPVDFMNKDSLMGVQGKVIVEMAELATLRKSSVEDAKQWITRPVDSYRPPYSREVRERKRMFIVGGSVNPDGLGLFSDTTGNRRYWPVECNIEMIDIKAISEVKEQFWAEAVHLYKSGVRPVLDKDEEKLAKVEQAARMVVDVMDDEVVNAIELVCRHKAVQGGFTMNDLMAEMKINVERRSAALMGRVNASLRAVGYIDVMRRGEDGRRSKIWYKASDKEYLINNEPKPVQSELDEVIVF